MTTKHIASGALALLILTGGTVTASRPALAAAHDSDDGRQMRGHVVAIHGNRVTLQLLNGHNIVVNDAAAGPQTLTVGEQIAVIGGFGAGDVFNARMITHPGLARTISGTVVTHTGGKVIVKTDAGQTVTVDTLSASEAGSVNLPHGARATFTGGYGENNVFYADVVARAH